LPPSSDSNTKETSMSSKHAEAQAEAIKSIADWQKGVSGAPRAYARCIPLSHPIPSRYWGYVCLDRVVCRLSSNLDSFLTHFCFL
jgi:hypothetical protein